MKIRKIKVPIKETTTLVSSFSQLLILQCSIGVLVHLHVYKYVCVCVHVCVCMCVCVLL